MDKIKEKGEKQKTNKGCSMQWICGNSHLWISWVQDSIQQMDARTDE